MAYLRLLLLSLLLLPLSSSSPAALPAFFLNNWSESNPLILAWSSGTDCPQKPASRFPGATTVRFKGASLLSVDTFALEIDGVILADPMQFSGPGAVLEKTGQLHTEYTKYGNKSMSVSLSKSYYMPEGEQFFIVSLTLSSPNSQMHKVSLLDLTHSDAPAHGYWDNGVIVDMNMAAAIGGFNDEDAFHQIGDSEGTDPSTNPLVSFATTGNVSQNSDWRCNRLAVGQVAEDLSVGNEPVTVYYYRAFGSSVDEAKAIVQRVKSKTPQYWIDATAKAHDNWLKVKVEESFYAKTLLSFKHALNPAIGTFVASFHPLYEYKVWSRDGIFAAMIFALAGYPNESAQYLKWAANAKLRQDGAFHTCYDVFTGEPVGFVEPQYDGTGAFALAVLVHVHLYGNGIISDVEARIEELEDFYLNNKGKYGLALPDYSIWEESSDPHSGKPLSTSYFTFTQSMMYAGTRASAILEVIKNSGKNSSKSLQLFDRSEEIRNAVRTHLWNESTQSYVRAMNDNRVDSATSAVVFTGLENDPVRASSHIQHISNVLSVLGSGISRYENDPFFYDSIYSPCAKYQVGAAAPPWPVTTMFTAWAEMVLGNYSSASERISWVLDHAALGDMPVGEAVDGITGDFVAASAPDLYEGGGVAAASMLWLKRLVPNFITILFH